MIGISWLGTDGSVWDLRGGPVRITPGGMAGLAMPVLEDQTKATAMQDGQLLTGWRIKPRPVWLPFKFAGSANIDVEGVQRAFWRSMAIGETGRLTVTDSLGATRSIGLRFQDDGGLAYRLDPSVLTDAFGISFVADQPWWEGVPVVRSYSLGQSLTPLGFFGDTGGATPFNITRSQGSTTATINNPGDDTAWIKWEIQGPATAVRLGVDGHYVGGPIAVSLGALLSIESDPRRQLAYLDAVKVTRQLTEIDFAPVPKGASVPLSIDITGTGVVTATIVPRYARAF